MYVEVKGVFRAARVDQENIDTLAENVRAVRRFITERVFPFLNQYDLPGSAPEA
jgi:hypothetical protein